MRLAVVVLSVFLLPIVSHAAVVINEVAWMGTEGSANDEWIELYNSGSKSVLLDGWSLNDGMNLSIALSGTIGAGEYAVLERTDDSSAPGSAFLIYTGALTNTGAVLTLLRADGSMEDRVGGGENWENIGGDNTTKETAQYTSSGWLTGNGTPGKANVAYETVDELEEEEESEEIETKTKQVSVGTDTALKLVLPDVSLSLAVDIPDVVYVHQSFEASVEPSGLGEVVMDSLQYTWNFGDMHTKGGKEVDHVFMYPGEYVVTLHATYARHEQIGRKPITVLPVSFSISKNLKGDAQIHNTAKYEIDISGYKVRGAREVVFPNNTILLSNGTITIPKDMIGVPSKAQIQMLNTENVLVAALGIPVSLTQEQRNENQIFSVPSETAPGSEEFIFSEQEEISQTASQTVESKGATSTKLVANVAASSEGVLTETLPYIGLIGIMLMGIFGVYASGAKKYN